MTCCFCAPSVQRRTTVPRVLLAATTKELSATKGGTQLVPPFPLFEETVPWGMAEQGGADQIFAPALHRISRHG